MYFFANGIANLDGGIVRSLSRDFITGDQGGHRHYTDYLRGTFPTTSSSSTSLEAGTGVPTPPANPRYVDTDGRSAEWFCKIDYDTYFFAGYLQYFVRDYKRWDDATTGQHYFGHLLYHRNTWTVCVLESKDVA